MDKLICTAAVSDVRRTHLLIGGLVATSALYLASRTERGAAIAADVVGGVVNALLPRGIRNNNPGNLRHIERSPWRGQVGKDVDGFGIYDTMANGVRASGQQLLKYRRSGLDTVRKLISTWAPSSENNTAAYVAQVSKALNVAADQRIDVEILLDDLATAIFRHENGGLFTLAIGDISKWVRLP